MTGTHSLSYLQALRKPRLAAFLAGDLVSRIGDGMTLVALPVIVLGLLSELPAALKLSLVYAVPLAAPLLVSLFFGLGRRRFDPAVTTAADSVLRISFYGLAAALALAGTLSFGWLVALLSAGSVLRSLGSGARRLFALGLAGPEGSYAVNGMIGLSLGAGMFVLGPACGGLLLLSGPAASALLANAGTYAVLLAAVLAVRRSGAETQSRPADPSAAVSGWSILRSKPRILRLFAVLFLYDLFYAPVEIASWLCRTTNTRGLNGAYTNPAAAKATKAAVPVPASPSAATHSAQPEITATSTGAGGNRRRKFTATAPASAPKP